MVFEFILFGVHWVSWICRFISLIKFEKFSAIISSIFFIHFPISPLFLSLWWHKSLSFCIVLWVFQALLIFWKIFCYSNWIISPYLSLNSWILSFVTSVLVTLFSDSLIIVVFFSLKISLWLLFISLFLCWDFLTIHFKSIHACWNFFLISSKELY